MGILDGKRILVTGVLTDASIAFGIAKTAQEEGAEVVLTSVGRAMRITERVARKLPEPCDLLELDVTNPDHVVEVREALGANGGTIDGAVHAIGFAPQSCLGDGFMEAPWEDVSVAVQISAYSLKTLAEVVVPLMPNGGSIIGMDFDATVAWPVYSWMGVAKAAFESTSRYLAMELGPKGISCNLVSAGPIRSTAAKSIPGFSEFEDVWQARAPLGWDLKDTEPVARTTVAMLSDFFTGTTGEVVHVDGGFHAIGA
jgi:enoyl-[acyl-carrier protein] reductase I